MFRRYSSEDRLPPVVGVGQVVPVPVVERDQELLSFLQVVGVVYSDRARATGRKDATRTGNRGGSAVMMMHAARGTVRDRGRRREERRDETERQEMNSRGVEHPEEGDLPKVQKSSSRAEATMAVDEESFRLYSSRGASKSEWGTLSSGRLSRKYLWYTRGENSKSSKAIHVFTGDSERIDSVTTTWPRLPAPPCVVPTPP